MNIKTIFESFRQLKVLIIGDVMIDRYLQGKVDRISPEAPVPVLSWKNSEDRLGGAANVALNVHALGATPLLCSVIGADENHHSFLDQLRQMELDESGLFVSKERLCTVKTRVIAQNQHLLRVDKENTHSLSQQEKSNLLKSIHRCLEKQTIDVIIFQDYNKGVLSADLIAEIIDEAKQKNIPTIVDPKFSNFWAYQGVTLFKPNLREIQDQLNFPILPEPGSLLEAAKHIRQRLGNEMTLVTLSEKGLFVESHGQHELIPTHPRNIADVCGAGDTVVSVVALAMALRLPLTEIGQLANLAGGQVCEKVGVVPVDREQLQREYEQLVVEGGR